VSDSVERYAGCAVDVHDRQDNRTGRASVRAKAVAKAGTIPKRPVRKEEPVELNMHP
jgi:hypothetical protein